MRPPVPPEAFETAEVLPPAGRPRFRSVGDLVPESDCLLLLRPVVDPAALPPRGVLARGVRLDGELFLDDRPPLARGSSSSSIMSCCWMTYCSSSASTSSPSFSYCGGTSATSSEPITWKLSESAAFYSSSCGEPSSPSSLSLSSSSYRVQNNTQKGTQSGKR